MAKVCVPGHEAAAVVDVALRDQGVGEANALLSREKPGSPSPARSRIGGAAEQPYGYADPDGHVWAVLWFAEG